MRVEGVDVRPVDSCFCVEVVGSEVTRADVPVGVAFASLIVEEDVGSVKGASTEFRSETTSLGRADMRIDSAFVVVGVLAAMVCLSRPALLA